MSYEPSEEIVDRYARLLVDFALGDGDGIKRGDTVRVVGSEETKPLFAEVCRAVWRSGGNVISEMSPAQDERFNLERDFYELADDAQLDHFPEKYRRGLLDEIDHLIYIDGSDYPQAMKDVDPQKMMRRQAAFMPMIAWQQEKEAAGLLHWTIGLWGTAAMAAEAGLTVEQYWDQIIKACFLDDPDPIARWRETLESIHHYRDWLNSLPIERLHLEAEEHRPVAYAGRASPVDRRQRPQHPELRDLHESRLARHQRARQVQRAALQPRDDRPRGAPGVHRRPGHRRERG